MFAYSFLISYDPLPFNDIIYNIFLSLILFFAAFLFFVSLAKGLPILFIFLKDNVLLCWSFLFYLLSFNVISALILIISHLMMALGWGCF